MSIIVSKNGIGAVKLNKTPFGLEDTLQQYIHNNPESIPLYDIKEDVQLLILAREFMTGSGPIDALGIDKDGEIYLVETKLYKNPDKRTVLAQVLDYGASLWKSHPDFDSFLLQINNAVQKNFNQTVREKIQSFFSLEEDDIDTLLSNMSNNLNEGNFKFVVLMDTIHDQLKDLILYMNQNSKFDIYGVELEYYKHDEFEIIIPKLFGSEVKKDIVSRTYDNTFISNDEFMSLYKDAGLGERISEVIKLNSDLQSGETVIKGWSADRTPKNINFIYRSPNRTKMSLVISFGYNKNSPDYFLNFWLYEKEIEDKLISKITQFLQQETTHLLSDMKYGVIARFPLQEFTKEKFITFFKSLEN